MVLNLNGYNRSGDHQTGKGQRVTLVIDNSLTPVAVTGVNLTRAELLAEGYVTSATLAANNSINIAGVNYTVDATYDAALASQMNVDSIHAAYVAKANIVYMDISVVPSATWYGAGTFAAIGADDVEMELVFEQKGFLAGTNPYVKGAVTVVASVDGGAGGDSQADVADVIEGITLQSTVLADVVIAEGTNFAARVKVSAHLQS